jgi:hypothetical protein
VRRDVASGGSGRSEELTFLTKDLTRFGNRVRRSCSNLLWEMNIRPARNDSSPSIPWFDPFQFANTQITRREAVSFLTGGAIAALVVYLFGYPRAQPPHSNPVPSTTTTTLSITKSSTQSTSITSTTSQQVTQTQPPPPPPPSVPGTSIVATGAIDTAGWAIFS